MSQALPCKLILGIQNIDLKVDANEEHCVRAGAKLVNELIQYYEKKTNSSDPNQVLALVALDLAMCGIKFDKERKHQDTAVLENNQSLLDLVHSYLN